MAATTAGALKAAIEGFGLGLSAYREAAPSKPDGTTGLPRRLPSVPFPFCTVREGIVAVKNQDGDFGDPDAQQTERETATVDLWQRWRDSNGKPAEDYALPGQLARKLHGANLGSIGTPPRRVYGVVVSSVARLLEEEENVVHHAITLTVHREV